MPTAFDAADLQGAVISLKCGVQLLLITNTCESNEVDIAKSDEGWQSANAIVIILTSGDEAPEVGITKDTMIR